MVIVIGIMSYNSFSVIYQYLSSPISYTIFKYALILFVIYLTWRLFIHIYIIASSPSGIHYVNLKRRSLQMVPSYNPFSFEANYTSANYSGIKCTLQSEQSCYVQAVWGVPIFSLFELLHGDWQSLIDAIITHNPSKRFSTKCICANDSFILPAGGKTSIEFKPHVDFSETLSAKEGTCMRKVYPLVVLMVLKEKDEIADSFVVAMASAVHIADNALLLYPQLIGQYIKLASGQIGEVKKIFLSSPETSEGRGGDQYDLCLACYHRPVSMVFLPCRHACLCNVCFNLCKKCPVCRATSLYYFELPDVVIGENN